MRRGCIETVCQCKFNVTSAGSFIHVTPRLFNLLPRHPSQALMEGRPFSVSRANRRDRSIYQALLELYPFAMLSRRWMPRERTISCRLLKSAARRRAQKTAPTARPVAKSSSNRCRLDPRMLFRGHAPCVG